MVDQPRYDVVVVGTGIAGSIVALRLAMAGKRVCMIEAGPAVPDNRGEYMETFFVSNAKTPESPYPPVALDPGRQPAPRATILGLNAWTDPEKSYLVQPKPETPLPQNLPFASTYERVGGGTTWHWLGTSLRLVPHDLEMYSYYGVFDPAADWPIGYDELALLYGRAEAEIGVSASVAQQAPLEQAIGLTYPSGYQYPMNPIPPSVVDQAVSQAVAGLDSPISDGKPVFVTPTPAGRNSQPYQDRRVCAGNTNCIPICPIQAKYDATVTLGKAQDTGRVTVINQAVACKVLTDENGRVSGIQYIPWVRDLDPAGRPVQTVTGAAYVLAAHAIENAKLLLLSANQQFPRGAANSSDQVGRNLMDHVLYLSWALAPTPLYPYRGPLSTSGIESLRDGDFRRHRAAFRMEIGNEGWNFPIGDPYVTVQDFINGTNVSRLNPIAPPSLFPYPPPPGRALGGVELAKAINDRLTRQFRIACLLEQSPQAGNRVTLDRQRTDGLGLARPRICYGLDPYTLKGYAAARQTSSAVYQRMNAVEFTDYSTPAAKTQPGYFEFEGVSYIMFGAGHLVGTHRMGKDKASSVTNAAQRSWDHDNLWIVGSGSFPTVATPNPTDTLAALAFKAADDVLQALGA